MVKIYTLPTCPICEMAKKKMDDKCIEYEERPFEEGESTLFYTDMAPVLDTGTTYIISPSEINKWIKEAPYGYKG